MDLSKWLDLDSKPSHQSHYLLVGFPPALQEECELDEGHHRQYFLPSVAQQPVSEVPVPKCISVDYDRRRHEIQQSFLSSPTAPYYLRELSDVVEFNIEGLDVFYVIISRVFGPIYKFRDCRVFRK